MIAHVITLRRTPLTLPFFDYLVPHELVDTIQVGQLVTIPFRSNTQYGVVKHIHKEHGESNKPTTALKAISSIVAQTPIISPEHLLFLEEVAELYHVSLGFVVKSNIPELPKKIVFEEHARAATHTLFDKPTLETYSGQSDKHTVIQKYLSTNGQTLVLVPEIEDIELIRAQLPIEQQKTAIGFHSNLKTKEYREQWLSVWKGEKKIIIGTRQALFLSFYNLESIIVDNEGHPSHKSWDMAPRFHTRDAALSLAKYEGAKLVLTTHTPTVESYYFALKHIYTAGATVLPHKPTIPYHIVDTTSERSGKNFLLLSNEVQRYITKTQGLIFLFLNKLGSSSYSACRDCGFVFKCSKCKRTYTYSEKKRLLSCSWCKMSEPAPLACPQCSGTGIYTIGHGTEKLEKELAAIFPDRPVLRIDSTSALKELVDVPANALIVGTQQAWNKITWDTLSAMVFVDADAALYSPEYKTTEYQWQHMHDALSKLPHSAELFLQTKHPDHALYRGLTDPDSFYTNELSTRKLFGYPPFYFMVKMFASAPTETAIHSEANEVYRQLLKLTKTLENITITPNLAMVPPFQKGVYWHVIIAKIGYRNYKQLIREIVKIIPHNWKVDLNPNTLLSL